MKVMFELINVLKEVELIGDFIICLVLMEELKDFLFVDIWNYYC